MKNTRKQKEEEQLFIPMSPEAAAIIHAHLPEPWVGRAKFVGSNYENFKTMSVEAADKDADNATKQKS